MSARLPKMFQGVPLVRGLGMKSLEGYVERHALSEWPKGHAGFYMVVANDPDDVDTLNSARSFLTLKEATRYARGLGNGNMDWRVLRCSSALLVIGTESDL